MSFSQLILHSSLQVDNNQIFALLHIECIIDVMKLTHYKQCTWMALAAGLERK
jgi:hypothetical protein